MSRPEKFYKYRQASGDAAAFLERTLLQDEIYFAAPRTFNDPFDCTAVFAEETGTDEDLMQNYMMLARKHGPPMSEQDLRKDAEAMIADPTRNPRNEAVRNSIQDEHSRMTRGTTGVFCMSEVRDDILMWSHYGDYHKGVCLEFDGTGKLTQHAMKVEYSMQRPVIYQHDSNNTKFEKALLTKSIHWSYEKEWRMINYRGGAGAVKFRPENLTGLIVGADAPMKTLQLVRRLNKQRSTPLKLFKAKVSRSMFSVDITEIAA